MALLMLLEGCTHSAPETAQNNVTAADVTACHTFGHTAYMRTEPSQAQADQTFADLNKATSSTLRSEAESAESAYASHDVNSFRDHVRALVQECQHLGLIDAEGNPT